MACCRRSGPSPGRRRRSSRGLPRSGCGWSAPRGGRDGDLRREVAHDLRGRVLAMEHREWPTAVGGVVAGGRERDYEVGLAVEEPRDAIHLHSRLARAVHDEERALLRVDELVEDLERVGRGLERRGGRGGGDGARGGGGETRAGG